MKRQFMEMMNNVAAQLKMINAMPEAERIETLCSTPEMKYRTHFMQSILNAGYSQTLASKMALAMRIDVNKFDLEIAESFAEGSIIPVLTMMQENASKLPLYKDLTQEETLLAIASGMKLSIQL